jgi:hypothetical protein
VLAASCWAAAAGGCCCQYLQGHLCPLLRLVVLLVVLLVWLWLVPQ